MKSTSLSVRGKIKKKWMKRIRERERGRGRGRERERRGGVGGSLFSKV